ncbi:MAG: SLC13 family permease [Candidatus Omnitrophota bacterium]|nr:SLC13 family permease [Candidatus Omnitrophota bacterium]
MRNALLYTAGLILTVLASSTLGLTTKQLIAVGGFSAIFFGAIFFWSYRLAFALFGVGILMVAGLLDVPHIIEFANVDIILFLIGMMIIVGYLEEKQFFEHLVNKLISLVGMNGNRLIILMLIMSGISAALVDEVTSILFMITAMLNITSRYKLNPVPFIIMVVFATNIGSSATVVGNPIGVIIALRSSLGFMDFIRWATPISIIVLLATIAAFFIYYSKPIKELHAAMQAHKREKAIKEAIPEKKVMPRDTIIAGAVFACVIVCLVLHHQIEHLLGLAKNTMLLGTSIIGAATVLVIGRKQARDIVERKVDWWTLAFFLFLFASVGTLTYQGITSVVAKNIVDSAGKNIPLLMSICVWTSGALTAVMDNVLAVATFIPIIKDIGSMGVDVFPLWWAILFGSTILGNLTIIGSTANIVAVGHLERCKICQISFLEWLKAGIAIAIPGLALAHLLLFLQLGLMLK